MFFAELMNKTSCRLCALRLLANWLRHVHKHTKAGHALKTIDIMETLTCFYQKKKKKLKKHTYILQQGARNEIVKISSNFQNYTVRHTFTSYEKCIRFKNDVKKQLVVVGTRGNVNV